MKHSRFLTGLVLAALLPQVSHFQIPVEEFEDRVFVSCNTSITWLDGTTGTKRENGALLDLGKRHLDPRGLYKCLLDKKDSTVQVYYRMCQNCVELDSATLAGIIVTDIIATLLLALGVYCFAGHETGRLSGGADTQVLLKSEQLYQPLRNHEDAQYSRLGENWHQSK
ncbi:T-cell surface glycoprotein CD3 delta chain isoform X2 [Fukomys damarensis]|uniref:T-cell surface glycoprotein CD3 delta chain n=1 Tax=Fukomys damarensis TaxID=885580 RepID=A0A091DG01_FUKDA|nr:T-cell surface glycoprotein CD3 delta chain isoform X2 [Fukomys damarensis]KFO31079.1 T-cell surface glycoprotein CD3 delta chain [Fukomys damarensis]